MIVKTSISKTWQEKQFEPFNVALSIESNLPLDVMSPDGVDLIMRTTAEALQNTADAIYVERRRRNAT